MKLKKYVIGLGSDNSGLIKGLGAADSQITAFVSKAGKLLGGLGVGAGFAKLIKDFTGIGSELKTFSDSTGLAVEGVSRLGLALEQFGGDTADAAAALNGLQDSIRQAVDWGQGPLIDVMGRYGVAVQNSNGKIKTATELYYDLADVMQGLNKAQQRDLASSLGLDESSVRLLQQGRKGVEALLASRSDMAVMTKEDAEAAREWDMALKDLKQMMTGFGRELARTTLPVIQKFADFGKKIASEWQKHKSVIDHVANVVKENLVPAFAFAALKIGAALKPLMLKLAPLSMIALLIEDIAVFMQGGNSLLGDLLGDNGGKVRETLSKLFSGLGGIFTKVLSGDFKGAFEEAKKLWNEMILPLAKDFGKFLWNSFKDNFPTASKFIEDYFTEMGGMLSALIDGDTSEAAEHFKNLWTKVIFPLGKIIGKALWEGIKGLGGLFHELLMQGLDAVIEKLKDTKLGKWLGLDTVGPFSEAGKKKKLKEEAENSAGTAKNHGWSTESYREQMIAAKNGKPVPGISNPPVNNSPSNTNNIVVTQTFNGPADPTAVKEAAQSGVEQGVAAVPGYTDTLAFGQGAY